MNDDLERLATLRDPLRRRLYEHVRGRGEPVKRDDAAEAVGIGRSLAAYHLDKLADQGLLRTSYRRPEGRTGPGAGRPAKLYERVEDEVAVSLPARDYEFASRLMAAAAEADQSGSAAEALHGVARAQGRELGRQLRGQDLETALRTRGYEPYRDADGVIRLRNCPFHRLAAEHRELVCGMNHSFLQGLLDGLDRNDLAGRLDPQPGRCCVAIASAAA
jgi:predicted ArsR family transcriptional regulator